MTMGHRQYEVACALAASGQLSDEEFAEFARHLDRCSDCRGRLAELALVSSGITLVRAAKIPRPGAPKGMLERFIARAAREGIPLRQARQGTYGFHLGGASALAALCLLLAMLTWAFALHGGRGTVTLRVSNSEQMLPLCATEAVGSVTQDHAASANVLAHPKAVRREVAVKRVAFAEPRAGADEAWSGAADSSGMLRRGSLDASDLRSPTLWSSTPQSLRFFVPASSAFEVKGERIEELFLESNQAAQGGKRVFSYDPKIASLTLLEAFHAAQTQSRGPGMQPFRFTLPALQ